MYSRKAKADSAGYAKSKQAYIGNGCLDTLRIHNKGTDLVYIQFHDAAAVPADAVAPGAAPIPVAAGSYYESDTPFDFLAGLAIVASSTAATKTIIAGNDVWITAEYKY